MVNFHHICRLCGHSRPQASPTHGYRALIQHSSQQNRPNNRHIWPTTNICCAFLYISTTNTCGLVRRSIHIWLVTYRAPPYLPNLIDNLHISDSLRLLNLNVIFFFFSGGAPPYLSHLTRVQVGGNDCPQPLVIPQPLVMNGEGSQLVILIRSTEIKTCITLNGSWLVIFQF